MKVKHTLKEANAYSLFNKKKKRKREKGQRKILDVHKHQSLNQLYSVDVFYMEWGKNILFHCFYKSICENLSLHNILKCARR